MIEALLDSWSIWHATAGFALGLFIGLLIKSTKKAAVFAFVVPASWEVIEANIVVSWLGLIEAESLTNSALDIGVGFATIMVGFLMSQRLLRK